MTPSDQCPALNGSIRHIRANIYAAENKQIIDLDMFYSKVFKQLKDFIDFQDIIVSTVIGRKLCFMSLLY